MADQRPADEADARRSRAILLQPFLARSNDFRVVRQAQIVVGAQNDDLADPLDVRGRTERAGQVVEPLELAGIGKRLQQVFGSAVEGGVGHYDHTAEESMRKSKSMSRSRSRSKILFS